MKIAAFNINGVNKRLDNLLAGLAETRPPACEGGGVALANGPPFSATQDDRTARALHRHHGGSSH
ncbi:hypothetical protein [Aliihoeflea sp. 40Bstr573]|uniref:hypothetical protein n=1 Tax=Aliihoeflea sp. 40Bstr573 TaxID=2696467 RepID=UPI002094A55E|nr:hypothetical protein [Aliihoeflea sp. 40Bstr573]MCO6388759.1 hypothetical protein [Aliihoeflea sp. 40Bstr573]